MHTQQSSHSSGLDGSILAEPSDAIPDDDRASIHSKHSLKTLPSSSGGMIATVPYRSPDLNSTASDDDFQFRNTITSRGAGKRAGAYADSDDEADWADLSRPGATGSVRITVNAADDPAVDAETKAMIMQERRRVLVRVGSQMLLLFIMCAVGIVLFLWLGLPVIDE